MSYEPSTTIVGNLTQDPELRFTPNGAPVANFTVASTPRNFDRQTNEWKDGETLFMRCTVWREMAEHVAESLVRGARVIVSGSLVSRSWDDKETGQKRTVVELQVDEIGPSLRYATAKVTKTQRGDQQGQGQQGGFGGAPQGAPQGQAQQAPAQGAPQGAPAQAPAQQAPAAGFGGNGGF